MYSVGLKNLKNKLSQYVRLAAQGEVILITDHDKVVAEIGQPKQGRSERINDVILAKAVKQGWLTPPIMVSKEVPPRKPMMSIETLLHELDQDRGDRE